MGLLRACADAVLVGAGTFRRARGHYWYPGVIDPSRAESYADARRALGLSAQPKLVLVSESGTFDVSEPALRDAIVVTTPLAATRLASELPSTARVLGLGAGRVRLAEVVRLLNDEGLNLILSEGGPSLVAELVSERMLDELFLTSSPILFGRTAGDGRRALVEGLDLGGVPLELLSCRRQGSHLFSRYRVSKTVPAPAG
jgi:riboflavin biosynthesis pyrimidine reductase